LINIPIKKLENNSFNSKIVSILHLSGFDRLAVKKIDFISIAIP